LPARNPRALREPTPSLDGTWDVQLEPDERFRPIVVPFAFEPKLSGSVRVPESRAADCSLTKGHAHGGKVNSP
jgi:hypothetical protein